MAPDLYHMEMSPPCRTVRMTAATIGVDLNLKVIDLRAGDHVKPDYLAINPQHLIPTLVDGSLNLAESRAISTYLINKYSPGHALYPLDPAIRARIDRYLQFDLGTLYKTISEYFYPRIVLGKELDPEKEEKMKTVLGFLEKFLADGDYLVGGEPTVADISIANSLSVFYCNGYSLEAFPLVMAFNERVQQMPHWQEVNKAAVESFRKLVLSRINKE